MLRNKGQAGTILLSRRRPFKLKRNAHAAVHINWYAALTFELAVRHLALPKTAAAPDRWRGPAQHCRKPMFRHFLFLPENILL